MKSLAVFAVLILVAVSVFAEGPTPGVYKSVTGQIMEGNFSESFVDAPYHDGVVNNTIHALSYDGMDLGGQWQVFCPSILNTNLIFDGVVGGNGFVEYGTDYVGGTLWLSGTGPWGDGTMDYEAIVDQFYVHSTHFFQDGVRYAVISDIRMTGHFDLPVEQCFTYEIANGEILGAGTILDKPAEYPSFLDYFNCPAGTVNQGSWGLVYGITLSIYGDCLVATQESTWGKIKSLYSE